MFCLLDVWSVERNFISWREPPCVNVAMVLTTATRSERTPAKKKFLKAGNSNTKSSKPNLASSRQKATQDAQTTSRSFLYTTMLIPPFTGSPNLSVKAWFQKIEEAIPNEKVQPHQRTQIILNALDQNVRTVVENVEKELSVLTGKMWVWDVDKLRELLIGLESTSLVIQLDVELTLGQSKLLETVRLYSYL